MFYDKVCQLHAVGWRYSLDKLISFLIKTDNDINEIVLNVILNAHNTNKFSFYRPTTELLGGRGWWYVFL